MHVQAPWCSLSTVVSNWWFWYGYLEATCWPEALLNGDYLFYYPRDYSWRVKWPWKLLCLFWTQYIWHLESWIFYPQISYIQESWTVFWHGLEMSLPDICCRLSLNFVFWFETQSLFKRWIQFSSRQFTTPRFGSAALACSLLGREKLFRFLKAVQTME